MAKRVFSGIQPTGIPHLGNYLGALRQWVALQKAYECLYCIVDLHALTVPVKTTEIRENIFLTAASCLAAGVDPEQSALFVQSDVAEHAELAWILTCFTYMGELRRMTQFKEKAGSVGEVTGAGLFNYPVLMAADILLYDATHVPVGEDQKQHLELARTIARRVNGIYGEIFTAPEPVIPKQGARIMALDNPANKMSKSAPSAYSYVTLTDTPDMIQAKFKSAVTDSGKEIQYQPETKPALSNLLEIFSLVSGETIPALEARYAGKGYAVFKSDLGGAVAEFLRPIQERLQSLQSNPDQVYEALRLGAQRARESAAKKMAQVKSVIGAGSLRTGPKVFK